MVAGRALLAKQGRRLGGKDTYGYVVVRETVQVPGRGPRLVPVGMVPDPDRAYWVRYIFRRYAGDPVTIEGLARELDRLGAPSPRGGHWSECGIRWILGNPDRRDLSALSLDRFDTAGALAAESTVF